MNSSITGILFDRNPDLLFIFTIFEHMCLNTLYGDCNSPMNPVQRILSEVLIFHENTEILTSGESNYLYI